MLTSDQIADRIEDVWPEGPKVCWAFCGHIFKVKDKNNYPLLSNDPQSKLWIADRFGFVLSLFLE